MLMDCKCGATNRIPSAPVKRYRCGKCSYEFTPADLVRVRIEPPPPPPDELDDYDEENYREEG